MKRNKLIIGAVGVVATAAAFVLTSWNPNGSNGAYTQQDLSIFKKKDANDARLWLEARYIDPETGQRITQEKLNQIDAAVRMMPKNKSISFIEMGPDNIGGRTRAIQVDKVVNNQVWAGGVSGGLFRSSNGGNLWTKIDSYEGIGSPFISSMAQFSNGTFFVATGSNEEAWSGNGVWYTQDNGVTWSVLTGTATMNKVTEIETAQNGTTLWLATSTGIKKWNQGDASLTNITNAGSGSCTALKVSKDGQVIVASFGSSNRTYVSTDAGNSWQDKSGPSASGMVPTGAPRIEYAISHARVNGNYSLYAVRTGSNLLGMNVSHDNGATWSQFVGASGTPSNLDIYRNQGTYNSIVSVTPGNNQKILIGGIDVWKWQQTTSSPVSGGFEKLTEWFLSPTSDKYAHADQHEMQWDGNKLYAGNDGGIGITYDPEDNWIPANRGFNIAQFYGVAYDRHGAVLGGTQDNGSLYNDHSLSTWKSFSEISGGDGFQAEISFYNPDILFTTSQFGTVYRSTDGGNSVGLYVPDNTPASYAPFGSESSIHPFHTRIFLAEYYDLNSEDSVLFIPTNDYSAGDQIKIPSMATGDSILYTTPTDLYYDDTLFYSPSVSNLNATSIVDDISGTIVFLDLYPWSHVGTSGSGGNPPAVGDTLEVIYQAGPDTVVVASLGTFPHYFGQNTATGEILDMGLDSVIYDGVSWDTLTIQDPYQSWFLVYVNINGGELWGTRNALRLSSTDQKWGIVAQGIGGGSFNTIDVEFSKDLNHMFISTGGSQVTRVDGLGSLYTSSPTFEDDAFVTNSPVTTVTTFNPGGSVSGIHVNPSNPDDMITVSSSGSVKRSANATAASPSFTNLSAITSPSPMVYDGIIDRDDPNVIVVGTSHGAFVSEDGGTSWNDASIGFTGTPVYEVKQSWRTWNEGNYRPGEIYIATFGRGIWSSSSYLGVEDGNNNTNNVIKEAFRTNLKAFPNPTNASTTLSFQLENQSDVYVNVYNLSGRLVQTIKKSNLGSGTQLIQLDGNKLSTGTYIVKFQAGSVKETIKFVKL